MQKLIVACLLILVACRDERAATVAGDTTETGAIIDTVPSSPITSRDDSVIASAAGQQLVVTPRGDTIQWLGGTMFNVDSTKEYGSDYYAKNGSKYLRVTLMIGLRPDGKPIQITKARVLLPAMTSEGELILGGFCSIDGVHDPRVLAIATVHEGETYGRARYAWRFDPVTQSLSGIPTSHVTCVQVEGED